MIYFFIFAIAFITVYLSTPNIRYVALRFSIVDKRNHHKIHKKAIAKLGGLAIYFGFLSGLIIAAIFNIAFFQTHFFQITGLIICATLILALGVYDDFQGAGARVKLLVQLTIALLLIKIGFRLEKVFIPGLIDINLGILSTPITILWLVGITNAINLIDGLDGLAVGIITIVFFFFALYGILLKESFIVFASLALIGANLAFLRYNFYPAKIFLGDTGSLFLGFIVGSFAIYRSTPENLNNLFFLPACVVLFLPIVDTVFAVFRRILRKQHIFRSDFCHIHHYYMKLGFGHAHTVKRFYLITILLGVASLSIIYIYLHFLNI